jgi:hypothetical protein
MQITVGLGHSVAVLLVVVRMLTVAAPALANQRRAFGLSGRGVWVGTRSDGQRQRQPVPGCAARWCELAYIASVIFWHTAIGRRVGVPATFAACS